MTRTIVALMVLWLALQGCAGRCDGPSSGGLAACTHEDMFLLADAAAVSGDPHAIDGDEKAQVRKALSSACRAAFDDAALPLPIEFRALTRYTADRAVHRFLSFVTDKGLKEAVRAFPITSLSDIADPKTQRTPAIGAPVGTPVKDVIDPAIIADKAVRTRVEGGMKFGDASGIGVVPIKAKDGATSVRLVSIPKPIVIDGVRRVDDASLGDGNFLIYLPRPYIVATNISLHRELYPHDASYVMEAMLRRPTPWNLDHVRMMLDDFFFELESFGFVLNGNRGYYLTRSQTNNLPSNVWQYYETAKAAGRADADEWLKETGIPLAVGVYEYWQSGKGLIALPGGGSANRWQVHGLGPVQEVWESHGTHGAYYYRVLERLMELTSMAEKERAVYERGFDIARALAPLDRRMIVFLRNAGLIRGAQGLIGRLYVLPRGHTSSDRDEPVLRGARKDEGSYVTFTERYYVNDRASRVSGYDTTDLYGPFNAFTTDFASAALNIQLYRHERDIAKMMRAAGRDGEIPKWDARALARKKMIFETMWDDAGGMIFDYDAVRGLLRTDYPFASSAYALWAKLFNVRDVGEREKLIRMVEYLSAHLEGPEGIYASGIETGLQWDKPYCWPIHQGMIVWGIRHYAGELTKAGIADKALYLEQTADRMALSYLKANYRIWMRSRGVELPEKVGSDRGLFTGYETGANYTWNLAAVWDLYDGLTERGKHHMHAYAALMQRAAARELKKR